MPAIVQIPVYLLDAVGVAALVPGAMLATPLHRPPPLASIHDSAVRIDTTGMPELSRFQARDGTWLAYRLYAADPGRVAIVVHGSSASSEEMNPTAKALAAAGVTAVALDIRGHGASGARGDVGYLGEVEDDLADLVAELRKSHPAARFALIGHSLGGGFVARVAGGPLGRNFETFVLLAPFLGPGAPTNRPNEGKGRWAEVDMPRIIALSLLAQLGLDFGQSLPVIAYANDPRSAKHTTSLYSFRLLASFGPQPDWATTKAAIQGAAAKTSLIAGADDELMDAAGYQREIQPLGVKVTVLPGVDHIGIVTAPAALAALVAAVKEE